MATLAYHDIFDYPLKKEEIRNYLISRKAGAGQLKDALKRLLLAKKVVQSRGYFSLKNRPNLAATRISKEKYSQSKLKRAFFYCTLLTLIPGVKMVAVSGALAMQNSDKDDDIDLVIVASGGFLWTTRFFANVLLTPFRRKPGSDKKSNKACLNLFLDENDLKIKDQNLYTAHELAQMKVLFDRDNTYEKLIKNNAWIKKLLPNWQPDEKHKAAGSKKKNSSFILEHILRLIQLSYMRSKITTEQISSTQLFFHPKNIQMWVLKEYEKRLKRETFSRHGRN